MFNSSQPVPSNSSLSQDIACHLRGGLHSSFSDTGRHGALDGIMVCYENMMKHFNL